MPATLWGRFARDVALWLFFPLLFLAIYVAHFKVPDSAILPHLRRVAALLGALALVRLVLVLALRDSLAYRALASLATTLLLGTLLLYYGLVLVGLQSWSRVVSWDLIASYLPQIGELMHTLQLSPLYVAAAILLPSLALLAGCWYYLRAYDWVGPLAARSRRRMLAIYLAGGVALLALEAVHFTGGATSGDFEPLRLTFFAEEAVLPLAANNIDHLRTAALNATHERARQNYRPAPDAVKRNVILIVVDALRPGNMGVYGYQRLTTPYLSALAQKGLLQRHDGMRASCAESACGLLSISSSIYLHQFASNPFTLQEVLKRHGYAVHMILGGDHTNFYGLRKLYGKVDSYYDGSMAKGFFGNDDTLVTQKVETLPHWNGKPTMFQFHLMSAHALGKRRAGTDHYVPAATYLKRASVYSAAAGTVLPSSRNHYDNGVLQTDGVIAQMLESLARKRYLDDAIVVVTADHGEAIGEHGMHGHSNSVHEELLRIPFLMLSYGKPMRPIGGDAINASQVDIAPSILAELKMPFPDTWMGMALQERHRARFTFFEQSNDRGLVDAGTPGQVWKYWKNQKTGAEFAFELNSDAREEHNRIRAVAPAVVHQWRRELLSDGDRRGPASR